MTHRGGEVTFTLADGSTSRVRAVPVAGMVTLHRDIATVDELCRVDLDGRPGYCDFEITTNPRNGRGTVVRTGARRHAPGRADMVDLRAELSGSEHTATAGAGLRLDVSARPLSRAHGANRAPPE